MLYLIIVRKYSGLAAFYLGICNPRSFIFTDASRPMLVFARALLVPGQARATVVEELSASRDRFLR